MGERFVILDRDGTLIEERNYLADPDQVELLPGVGGALRKLSCLGLGLIVITNQSGISRGYFSSFQLEQIHYRLSQLLTLEKVKLDGIYYCPHLPEDGCVCRKPNVGLLEKASLKHNFDPQKSFVIGDKECDIQLGQNVGATTFLVQTGYGQKTINEETVCPNYVVADLLEATTVITRLLG